MRPTLRRLAPWLPWPPLGGLAVADVVGVLPHLPYLCAAIAVGFAATHTVTGVVCQRMSANAERTAVAAERAAVTEALTRGYELASEHCIHHDTAAADLPVAVGETTTGGIQPLRIVRPDFAVPRARGRHHKDR